MRPGKIHFLFEKGDAAPFAHSLIDRFGQSALEEADTVVSIGGDGLLMQALRQAPGKNVCGIRPPGSNSRGFWTNADIEDADGLAAALEKAEAYPIKPLKAEIKFADGSETTRWGYNDLSIRSVDQELDPEMREKFGLSDIDVGIQSALLNLKASFGKATRGPYRIMGTGLIFAAPLGSTAMNRNYGGPSADIRDPIIVLTGIGTTEPLKGFNPISNHADTVFDVEVGSSYKRPVLLTFDSFGVKANKDGSPIERVRISTAADRPVNLVLTDDPGARAYSAMEPLR